MSLRIGVVGSGISGLSTAWTLAQEGHAVTIFESDNERFGGHSFTYHEEGQAPVDLGFQVFNLTTYPYLVELFNQLNVDHEPSDMSFALSIDSGRVEWASNVLGLKGLFAQRSNAYSPKFLQMLRETIRFGGEGTEVLNGESRWNDMTLGAYLTLRGYGDAFRDEYLLPMTAAVWSVPNETMLDFPVIPLIKFWENHHLMRPLGARPRWRVVKARSETYVNAIIDDLKKLPNCTVLLGSEVDKLTRDESCSTLHCTNGSTYSFDHVVLACHSNQSVNILREDKDQEMVELLKEIRYQPNEVVLHADRSLMPIRQEAWASWNVLDNTTESSGRNVCVTYWLNNLQNLPNDAPLRLCTLNPITPIDPDLIVESFTLEHPIFDKPAIKAQAKINKMQANPSGKTNVWFAGAWLGSGFHEDGIRSAVAACTGILGKLPTWAVIAGAPEHPALELIRGPSPEISMKQRLGMKVFSSVAGRGFKKGFIRVVYPDGNEETFGRESIREAELLSEPRVTMWINDLDMLMRCVRDSDVGLGEAYIEKQFEVNDLVALFQMLIINKASLTACLSSSNSLFAFCGSALYKLGNYLLHLHHLTKKNTVVGSRRNIEEHYDLGNDMYELFLDETMTYSAGIHREAYGATGVTKATELDLKSAQYMKLDEIIRRAQIKSTDHVLEIGCGWGSFAIRAATTVGCKVTGITISTEQLKLAKDRVSALGLDEQVNLIICDYRTLGTEGSEYKEACFDKIVSIEMIEAVGHEHLPEYFEVINRMLKPGGRATIQAISMKNENYMEYCAGSDFIRRHIFPGGHLPCMDAVKWATQDTDLAIEENFDIGPDYAVTLRMWKENFIRNKEKIQKLGYPESFFRKWIFYFVYCEAGFEQKFILNYQITLRKDSASHATQLKTHFANPNRLVFDTEMSSEIESKSLHNGSKNVPNLPMVSTAIPATLWALAAAISDSRELRLIATVAVLAVFVVSLLGIMFMGSYLKPPKSLPNRKTKHLWMKVWIDTLFSCLVVVTVIVSVTLYEVPTVTTKFPDSINKKGLETMDSFLVVTMLLFTSFGRLASATGRTLKFVETMPYLMHSIVFSVVTAFALDTSSSNTSSAALFIALLHGFGELHSLSRGARQLLSLQGYKLQNSKLFKAVCIGEMFSVVLTKVSPLLVFTAFKTRFLITLTVSGMSEAQCVLPVRLLVVALVALLIGSFNAASRSLNELKIAYENGWKTDELVREFARSKEDLIKTMASTSAVKSQVKVQNNSISALYHGTVMHKRFKVPGVSPSSNEFKYGVWMAYVDLDEVDTQTAFNDYPFVSINSKWNFATWNRSDYYKPEQPSLANSIRELVKTRLGLEIDGSVRMVTNLRCFGYGFNPVSIYYCFDGNDDLRAAVLEVSNTPWLDKRLYVIPVSEDEPTYRWKKDFHVSPFMDVLHDYQWTLKKPLDEINVIALSYRRAGQVDKTWKHVTSDAVTEPSDLGEDVKTFYVRLSMNKAEGTMEALKCFLWQPFMTFFVLLWIHYQAAVVMWKSCEYKQTPANQRQVGMLDLVKHVFIFTVATVWYVISFPFKLATRLIA